MNVSRIIGAVLSATVMVGTGVALAAPASAAPPAVNTVASAKTECDRNTERAILPVYVLNRDSAPIDVRVTTPYGEVKQSKIAPGKAYYHRFDTGRGSVAAGTVTIAAYKFQNGKGFYATSTAAFNASSCVVDPRLDTRAVDSDRDGRINAVSVRNVGAHTIQARISGVAGSTARTLAPGQTFTVADRADRSPVAVVTAYKFVEGKGYFTSRTVRP
ncbi:hypothetical protein EV383_2917 [Pseudonocardia sediminis]|uniref:Uncharacterized protein n=1 Tax=Pseudonocardia sediminis TaxID=1397368 RepID=A0A4Q7V0L5_PSEST|nr:hypothetical protein [Pseudonocardia sediminis]RZT86029.1 hypothetical protein EV383_2917 [Pseudonocardia sediminis]